MQSRVDCVKLAVKKARVWRLRQHPAVQALPFKEDVKKQDRINARVRFIEGDLSDVEFASWQANLSPPVPQERIQLLSEEAKAEFLRASHLMAPLCLSSDAFFPFR